MSYSNFELHMSEHTLEQTDITNPVTQATASELENIEAPMCATPPPPPPMPPYRLSWRVAPRSSHIQKAARASVLGLAKLSNAKPQPQSQYVPLSRALSERERADTVFGGDLDAPDLAGDGNVSGGEDGNGDDDDDLDSSSSLSLSDDEDEDIVDPEETLFYSRRFATPLDTNSVLQRPKRKSWRKAGKLKPIRSPPPTRHSAKVMTAGDSHPSSIKSKVLAPRLPQAFLPEPRIERPST